MHHPENIEQCRLRRMITAAITSRHFSRYSVSPNAGLIDRPCRLASYHKGAEYDPAIAVGMVLSRVVFHASDFLLLVRSTKAGIQLRRTPSALDSRLGGKDDKLEISRCLRARDVVATRYGRYCGSPTD
jgi:hypothetical protein